MIEKFIDKCSVKVWVEMNYDEQEDDGQELRERKTKRFLTIGWKWWWLIGKRRENYWEEKKNVLRLKFSSNRIEIFHFHFINITLSLLLSSSSHSDPYSQSLSWYIQWSWDPFGLKGQIRIVFRKDKKMIPIAVKISFSTLG